MRSARTLTAMLVVTVVAGIFAAPAQANLTRSQMFAKAAGSAAFSCFVYDCDRRRVFSVSGPINGLMTYKWRFYGLHNFHGRPYWARCDRVIRVSVKGVVSTSTYYNCA